MGLRVCTRCGDPKDTEEFAWKNKAKGRRHSHCKLCQSKTSAKHYSENKTEYIDRAKERYKDLRAENEKRLAELLSGKSCAKCPAKDPKVLEFVHKPGEVKKDTIRRLLGQSWEIVEAEIHKCLLLCANCRRRY